MTKQKKTQLWRPFVLKEGQLYLTPPPPGPRPYTVEDTKSILDQLLRLLNHEVIK